MISSINNEMYYQYQNVGSYSTGNASNAFALSNDSTATEETQETQLAPPKPVSQEEYSSSDHMEMMRGGKQPLEMAETSTTTEVDEETLLEYDTNGDGVLSAAEYSAMMEDKLTDASSSTESTNVTHTKGDISGIDADGDGTISTDEYEEMISQMGVTNALTAEEFYTQYDSNEDGEISQDEMPEPGSVGIASDSSTSTLVSGESVVSIVNETTEDITASSEYQQLIFKTLQAYKNHYESMFETEDGSLKKSQA